MAPIRRYLRITKYSALECRIYLENPALVDSWLLHPRHNVLPRVIEAVRPLVQPKLQEERERARKKTGAAKKKTIKDVVVTDDFEVSVYLVETPTRHSLLVKHKQFRDKRQTKLKSNSSKMLGGDSQDAAIDVDAVERGDAEIANLLVEDNDEDAVAMDAIPAVPSASATRKRRGRVTTIRDSEDEDEDEDEDEGDAEKANQPEVIGSDEDYSSNESPPASPRSEAPEESVAGGNGDAKKKLAMDISYEGFSIHGRVLCLVVKKHETAASKAKGKPKMAATQATVDNWISSTQMPAVEEES